MIDYTTYDDRALFSAFSGAEESAGEAEAAFSVFYKRHSTRLYYHILKLVHDPQTAEDTLQEMFAKVWDRKNKIHIEGSVEAYLNTTASNLVYDLFRKAEKDRNLMQQLKQAASAHYQDEASLLKNAEQLAADQWELLQKAIANLPPVRRRAFELCKLEGKSYNQVCEELGISMSTMKDHMAKAQKSIRGYLGGHGELAVAILVLLELMNER